MVTDIKITDGTVEIISVVLAKKHLRVEADYIEEDALIEIAIASARIESENFIERKLLKGTVEVSMDSFTDFDIALQSLNDTITKVEYFAPGGEERILLPEDKYNTSSSYTALVCKFKQDLPVVADKSDAVIVTISFGYEFGACPKDVVSALLLLVADAFDKRENRGAISHSAARNLLNPYRKWQ